MVKRYDAYSGGEMFECDDGEFIRVFDYVELEERVAELEKDAARYRWLRDNSFHDDLYELSRLRSGSWDDRVDEYMGDRND